MIWFCLGSFHMGEEFGYHLFTLEDLQIQNNEHLIKTLL